MPFPPPPLDPKEALTHIRTLARAAQDSAEVEVVHQHLEMILALVDKALPRRRHGDNLEPVTPEFLHKTALEIYDAGIALLQFLRFRGVQSVQG